MCVCVSAWVCVRVYACVCVKGPPSARRQTINKTNELMVLQRHGVMAVLQELHVCLCALVCLCVCVCACVCLCAQRRIVRYIYESQLLYFHPLYRYVLWWEHCARPDQRFNIVQQILCVCVSMCVFVCHSHSGSSNDAFHLLFGAGKVQWGCCGG